jgi:FAD/FMN-containing dehydrogenase
MSNIQIKTRQGKTVELKEKVVNLLKDQLHGSLMAAEDDAYEEARKVWNGSINKKPALIARCAGPADVMTTVNFAREHQLLISVRAGGHNVSGASMNDGGLVIDVSQMRSVHVDQQSRTAWVEGGARLGDLDHETTAFGLAAPVGVVSETGVAGLTLHGGLGWLVRKHGMSVDNLKSIEVVTADGQLLKTSENEHEDLFWALRGGGGNFGVVTGFEFNLHPIEPMVSFLMPIYSLDDSLDVLKTCQEYLKTAPEELMVVGTYWTAPSIPEVPEKHQGKPVVILLGCYSGPMEQADEITSPLRKISEPIADLSTKVSWKEAQSLLDEDYPEGKYYYWKSIYLDRLDEEVIGVLDQHSRKRPSDESSIDIWFLGGAMTKVAPTETAIINRYYPFMIAIEANWNNEADSESNIAWARALYKDLETFSSGGKYLNFPGYMEDQEEMMRGAYGNNLERLNEVKNKYDPENLFSGLIRLSPK